MRERSGLGRRVTMTLAAAAIAAGVGTAQVYRQMVRHMSEICEYKGKQTATAAIGRAIDECLADSRDDYIKITRGSDGKIISIETDPKAVNKLENDLKGRINDSLARVEDNEMHIPIGTLTGITALSGRGADITIRLHQIGAVEVDMKCDFCTTGLNQTRYSLRLEVSAELSAVLPAHSTDIKVRDEYIISETVIAGELPDTYVADPSYSDFI